MGDYPRALRVSGFILLVIGLADVAWLGYQAAANAYYGANLYLLALPLGILLLRGSLRAAQVTAFLAAFTGVSWLVTVVSAAGYVPADLALVTMRLRPLLGLGLLVAAMGPLAIAALLYRWLTLAPIRAAEAEAGLAPDRWRLWRRAWVGGALALVLSVATSLALGSLLRGVNLSQATTAARRQVGPAYKLFVYRWEQAQQGGSADLVAYNNRQFRVVHVTWRGSSA